MLDTQILGRWVRVFEEDPGHILTFSTYCDDVGGPGFELLSDGTIYRHTDVATEGSNSKAGTWSLDDKRLVMDFGPELVLSFDVIELKDSFLRLFPVISESVEMLVDMRPLDNRPRSKRYGPTRPRNRRPGLR